MTRVPSTIWLSAIALALLVQGCATVNTVERAQPIGQPEMVSDKRIITDSSLAKKVQIVSVNETTLPGGYLKVQVTVWNTTRRSHEFNYRFEWLDAAGMHLKTAASAFVPRHIQGLERIYLTAVAPTPEAKDFLVKFIEP